MIGMIVTGHGSFATGITSGLMLLAGDPEAYEAVDFDPEDSVDMLTEKLKGALTRLDSCEEILILADLAGGSPFNVSLRLKLSKEKHLEVIGGANLPVVLDAYLARGAAADVTGLAASSLEAGKAQMVLYTPSQTDDDDDYEE